MELDKAKKIVSTCDWQSWGDLDAVIDLYWANGINCTNSESIELRNLILDKIDGLTASAFEPYYSILLELKDCSGKNRYQPEDIYLEFPGNSSHPKPHENILYLRNKMRLSEDEKKLRGWDNSDNRIITLFRPEFSSKESIAYQFFNLISNTNRMGKEFMFLTDGKLNLGFVLDCGKESGATLTDVIEVSEPYSFGLIYKRRSRSFDEIFGKKGYSIQTHSLGSDNCMKSCWVNSTYLERELSAKFFCAINNIKEELHVAKRNSKEFQNNDENYEVEGNAEELKANHILIPTCKNQLVDEKYSCMDYSSLHKPDRRFSGSRNMKACYAEYQSKQKFESRVVKSPAIVIDTDSYTAFAYFWKDKNTDEHMQQPFVLDDHFLAYSLSDNYMPDEPIDFKRYKTAVDQLNKRLEPLCIKVAKQLSDIPGKPYHLNFEEKRFILDMLSGEIITGNITTKGTTEMPMRLAPCGFDIKPYLDKLEQKEFIIKKYSKDGVFLRYRKKEGVSYLALTLFAYIMNNKIATSYSSLDKETQELWDKRYNYNGWRLDEPKGDVSHYGWQKIIKTPNPKQFEDSYPANLEGERKLNLSDSGSRQIRGKYFEQLFSMKEGQIKTLKKAAVFLKKNPDRCMERLHIIHLILEVDEELSQKLTD